jgi:hypothetical protein
VSAPAVTGPLAGSVANAKTTWAIMAMGKNNGQFDLFWQLFVLDAATGRFRLVTPPGVASNGGLMISQPSEGPDVLVGFGVSQDLLFSPLALSVNAGRTWSPGGLEQGLVAEPSAVGLDQRGDAYAVVGGEKPAVVERSGSLTSWRTDVSRASLAVTPAGKRCQVGSIDGVAIAASDVPIVAASCRSAGVAGVFVSSSTTWELANIRVPASLRGDVLSALRIAPSSALFAAVGRRTSVVAIWQQGSPRSWTVSAPLVIPNRTALLATGTGPGGSQFVLWREGASERAEVIDGPGAPWRPLASVPAKTATIAYLANGHLEALSVDDTRLTVWRLGTGSLWTRVQVLTVPIAFGSSS